MQTWQKITPITIKTAIILPAKILTQKINIKIFMALRLTWSVNSFCSFKKTPINMTRLENPNTNFSPNFFKLKISLINFPLSIPSKSFKITSIKITSIVLSIWDRFPNFFLLKTTITVLRIINWVMLIKSLPNTWLK